MPSVLIIGASRGIGRELAEQYVRDGWQVIATVRQGDGPTGADVRHADLTDEASLKALADGIAEPVDVLIVVGGIGIMETGIDNIDPDGWMQMMRTNALGPMLAIRQLAPKVKDGGAVAALSSVLGSIASASPHYFGYRMSKAALNMGVAAYATEAGRGLRVAVLHPGWVRTAMGGPGADIDVEESASGLRQAIANLRPDGVGYVDWRGKTIPW